MSGSLTDKILQSLIVALLLLTVSCNDVRNAAEKKKMPAVTADSTGVYDAGDTWFSANTLLLLPRNPQPGEDFRILATGGSELKKARIIVTGPGGTLKAVKSRYVNENPAWRIDDFSGNSEGLCRASLFSGREELCSLDFMIAAEKRQQKSNAVWRTTRGWDKEMETLYSVWISALFYDCDEQASWSALHEITRNSEQNFLYNYLSLGEDDPESKNSVIMQPDCADNPFFLRAYFAWKMGLPFGYHIADRGWKGHSPNTGQWITNEAPASRTDPVQAFNIFLRKVMDGVHSGTARTAFNNENSDYYPVSLDRRSLLPGIVFADPYGHTMVIIRWIQQTNDKPGLLFSIDAQPDGTVAIKRFWKGNFMFSTDDVIGEPGFKAFRPVKLVNGKPYIMTNGELTAASGFIPFSTEQRKMAADAFYRSMGRIINPRPLDAEEAMTDLIQSLHEQLLVRVNSVANSEKYFKSHPGAVIEMPSGTSGVFLAGGQWEAYSTPNRDLRLLIAMDAVLEFPEMVAASPDQFDLPERISGEEIKDRLHKLLGEKASQLTISYTRSDGSSQELSLGELLKRRDAFEMAYNPNDGAEIRWGAPEGSLEIASCRRHAPAYQRERMQAVRPWFSKRLHPPT